MSCNLMWSCLKLSLIHALTWWPNFHNVLMRNLLRFGQDLCRSMPRWGLEHSASVFGHVSDGLAMVNRDCRGDGDNNRAPRALFPPSGEKIVINRSDWKYHWLDLNTAGLVMMSQVDWQRNIDRNICEIFQAILVFSILRGIEIDDTGGTKYSCQHWFLEGENIDNCWDKKNNYKVSIKLRIYWLPEKVTFDQINSGTL